MRFWIYSVLCRYFAPNKIATLRRKLAAPKSLDSLKLLYPHARAALLMSLVGRCEWEKYALWTQIVSQNNSRKSQSTALTTCQLFDNRRNDFQCTNQTVKHAPTDITPSRYISVYHWKANFSRLNIVWLSLKSHGNCKHKC